MVKKRLERLKPIVNPNHMKVTYCKRKKSLLKKAIELSILCSVDIYLLIHDRKKKRCIHFGSDSKQNLVSMFNSHCNREFFSNSDYSRVGGRQEDIQSPNLSQYDEERQSNF